MHGGDNDGFSASNCRSPAGGSLDEVYFGKMVICYNTDMAKVKIRVPRQKIAEFCRKNNIRKLAFFGSVLRDDFGPNSDVDVLVEFEPGKTPGLAFFGMQDELSRILNRRVDLNTPGFLSRHFRDRVMEEARVEYVKA